MRKVKYLHEELHYEGAVAEAVNSGLGLEEKKLPSWLLYDEAGDKLFQKITQLDEYYPTRCELSILNKHKEDIGYYLSHGTHSFKLIELGPGDGTKSEILLRHLAEAGMSFGYYPVDVSSAVLNELSQRLSPRYHQFEVHPIHARYDDAIPTVYGNERKVILFLGANIGNFNETEALQFLSDKTTSMTVGDLMLIGFDLKKAPRIIERAYDDSSGVTRDFNLNLLTRLNRELGANFDLGQFEHYPYYDPQSGTAKSYLMSLRSQSVYFEALSKSFYFQQWETINTEISQKYDLLTIDKLITSAGLEITDIFFDEQHYFCDVLATKRKQN